MLKLAEVTTLFSAIDFPSLLDSSLIDLESPLERFEISFDKLTIRFLSLDLIAFERLSKAICICSLALTKSVCLERLEFISSTALLTFSTFSAKTTSASLLVLVISSNSDKDLK